MYGLRIGDGLIVYIGIGSVSYNYYYNLFLSSIKSLFFIYDPSDILLK